MVLIGTKIQVSGGGSGLLINLSNQLDQEAGLVTGWVFRIGAFAAIFSSLLGVWQSVPYLFIDVMKPIRKDLNKPCVLSTIFVGHSCNSFDWIVLWVYQHAKGLCAERRIVYTNAGFGVIGFRIHF